MRTPKLLNLIAWPAVAGLITACSTPGGYNSPEYRLPDGSTVELTRTLEMPYRSTRVYIQGGEALPWNDVNQYAPYCSFGLNRNRDNRPLAVEIPATRFATSRFHIGVEAALDRGDPVRVARTAQDGDSGGLTRVSQSSSDTGGTPWPYTYYTRIELYSEQAPQVDDLTCAYRGEARGRNLTLDEIRDTLGDLVRLY